MSNSARKTVLISEPQGITHNLQFDNARPYLPYMWAILKSYWERHSSQEDPFDWLEPIWWNDMPDVVLRPYQDLRIDVLGLSCYTWNWNVQCGIAQQVKASNPDCLVVAGGPEPDYKDQDFFRKHPYIDIIAVKDGEITFNKILSKMSRDDRDFKDIGGLYLPGMNGDGHVCTGVAQVPTVFDHSPYVDQSAYYERLIKLNGSTSFDVILETNRGCPYSCSFCDWGSNTMSKVRRFAIERIEAEVDWMGRMKIDSLMLADANFGILPRDVEIADLLNATREKYNGYPRYIWYSAAKNHPDRVITIAKKFAESGMCAAHALSIQHTSQKVLAATERSNISGEKQVEVVKAMMEAHVPIEVQLILGIPGDTYALWKGCLADLMEWGIHEDYLIQAYRILPNAPVAEKSFMEAWQIKTVDRVMFDPTLRQIHERSKDILRKQEKIIVESRTYSREDWIKISTYAAFIKALHNGSLTQRIAVYLRLTHNVSYLKFYEQMIEDGFQRTVLTREWYQAVANHYRQFLENENNSDHMQLEALPRLTYSLQPFRWLYVQMCLHLDQFFDAMKAWLLDQYPSVRNLASVVDYQKELVILPTYDQNMGKTFRTDFDWTRYFEEARVRDGSQALAEPGPVLDVVVNATDRTSGEWRNNATREGGRYGKPLEWGSGDVEDRWAKWIERVVLCRSSAAMHNLQQLQFTEPDYPER